MKTLNYFFHKLVLLGVTFFILSLQSCVVYQHPREPMVKVSDIIQMSKDGATSKDIITKIKRSHTVYTLKADQLSKLQKQGVADSVVNFMEQTHINSAIRKAQYDSYNNYLWPGWGGFYGYPYFGWPYSYGGYWGPSLVIRGGGHYGGHGGHYR